MAAALYFSAVHMFPRLLESRMALRAAALVLGTATACFSSVFWENRGQLRDTDGNPCPEVLFVAEAPGLRLYLRTSGLSYVFVQPLPETSSPYRRRFLLRRVDLEWLGANPFFRWQGEQVAPARRSVYKPGSSVEGLRAYRSLSLQGLYPHVELRLTWTERGEFKYDLLTRRAEALSAVRFRYIGAEALQRAPDGSVVVTTELGQLRELPPIVYQSGRRLSGELLLRGDTLSFAVPEAVPAEELLFDPGVVWSTYYGGNQVEEFTAVATDNAGNAYCAGWSISPDFPVRNALQNSLATTVASDAVIAKFSPTGQPLWVTYYGGDSLEVASGIACDAVGNVAVVGTTASPNFPTQNAFQNALSGTSDAFLLRLNSAGQRLWATYYGGSGEEHAFGVAVERSSSALVVCGATSSTNFPVANAVQTTHGGGTLDGFLLKFAATGQRLWATYYGGNGEDILRGIATDSIGAVIAVGSTSSTNFPVQNALQPTFAGGGSDAVVLKLTPSGQRLWATYYGGNRQDVANAVSTDSRNAVIFGGSTLSDTIPILNAVQARRAAALDAFLTSLDSAGRLQWGTFYGGSSMEEIRGVAVARNRWVLACGYTYSSNFPRWFALQPYAGNGDAFVVMFHYVGTLQWSTPFGGSGYDVFYSLATDTGVGFYACGATTSSNYPTRNAEQAQLRGSSDAVLTRFDRETIRCRVLRQPLCAGDTATVEFTTTGSFFTDNSFTVVLSDSSGDFARSTLIGEQPGQGGGRITVRIPDTIPPGRHYRIRVLGSSPVTVGEPTDTLVILRPPVPPTIQVEPDTLLCPGDSAVLHIEPEEMATYTWRRNGAAISSSNAPRLVVRQPGRYTVELRTPCGTAVAEREILISSGTPPAVPAIRASGSLRFCRGDSLALSTSPQPEASYQWYRDGQPFGSDTPTVVVRDAGVYTLAVSNRCGVAYARDTVRVLVDEPLAKPSLAVRGAQRFCQGDSATLETSPQPTVQEYRWYRNGTLVMRNDRAWRYTVRQPGWYRVELLNTCGVVSSDSIAIEVVPLPAPPRLTVLGGLLLCPGDSTVLVTAEQPNARYRWYRNGQLAADTLLPRYVVRQAGTYTVEVLTPCGRASSPDSVTVQVLDTLPAPRVHAQGSAELCEGDSLVLWIDPVSGARYQWYRDGTPLGSDTSALVVRSAGTYWVRLSSPCGEAVSDSVRVWLIPRPVKPPLRADGSTRLCEGDSLRLWSTEQAGVEYEWYRNDTLLARNRSALTVREAGTYWIRALNRCGELSSDSVTITVVPRPPKPVITQQGDTLISSSPTGNQWLDSTGTPIPGATDQYFVPPRSGQYRVRVTIEGCSSESDPFRFSRRTEPVVLSLRGGRAAPGTVVRLPLLLRIPESGTAAQRLRCTLRVWARVLEPLPPTPAGTVSGDWRRIPLELPLGRLSSGETPVLEAPFRVLLGDRDRTPLILEELAWAPTALPTEVVVDTFFVDICREGGDRLFAPTATGAFLEIVPQPATRQVWLRYGMPEAGTVTVRIWTLWGEEVARPLEGWRTPGTHTEPLSLEGLAAGVYLVTLQTPSQVLSSLLRYLP